MRTASRSRRRWIENFSRNNIRKPYRSFFKKSVVGKTTRGNHKRIMIECLPKSICSRNYTVRGLAGGAASVEYDWVTEQGSINGQQMYYEIRKQGTFSGRWTLEQDGVVMAEGHKPSAMRRRFEVSSQAQNFTLRPESAFTRAFEIVVGERAVGSVRPAHAFTRRATVRCAETIPEHLQIFSFWLVGLMWRRRKRNHSSGGT